MAGDIWFWSLILAFSSFKSWTLRNVHVEGRVLRRVTMTISVRWFLPDHPALLTCGFRITRLTRWSSNFGTYSPGSLCAQRLTARCPVWKHRSTSHNTNVDNGSGRCRPLRRLPVASWSTWQPWKSSQHLSDRPHWITSIADMGRRLPLNLPPAGTPRSGCIYAQSRRSRVSFI